MEQVAKMRSFQISEGLISQRKGKNSIPVHVPQLQITYAMNSLSILQKHQILPPLLGTCLYNAFQNIIPSGNINGAFSISIYGIGNGIISTKKFGIFGNQGSNSSSPNDDCFVVIVVGGKWKGSQRRGGGWRILVEALRVDRFGVWWNGRECRHRGEEVGKGKNGGQSGR